MPKFPEAFKNPFHEGAIAQQLGADRSDNPYRPESSEFTSWTHGWCAALELGAQGSADGVAVLEQPDAQLPSPVLIVCDNIPARARMAGYLSVAGCHSIEVADANFALEFLVRRPEIRAVVISAEQRSVVDGPELAEMVVRRWPEVSHVIVVGTGDLPASRIPRGAAYLSRPVAPDVMLDVLRRPGRSRCVTTRAT